MSRRTCLLILSPPRSGSSCLSGCLQRCGADLGESLIVAPDGYNIKGYYENQKVLSLNRSTLRSMRVNILAISELQPDQITKTLTLVEWLRKLIDLDFDGRVISIKDPRIFLLKDLYLEALKDFDIKIIHLSRGRKASLGSLRRLWKRGDTGRFEQVYDFYTNGIEKLADQYPYYRILFERLVAEPLPTLAALTRFAELSWGKQEAAAVVEFVDRRIIQNA